MDYKTDYDDDDDDDDFHILQMKKLLCTAWACFHNDLCTLTAVVHLLSSLRQELMRSSSAAWQAVMAGVSCVCTSTTSTYRNNISSGWSFISH